MELYSLESDGSNQTPQSKLKAALGTLDVTLDAELAHYRAYRQHLTQSLQPATPPQPASIPATSPDPVTAAALVPPTSAGMMTTGSLARRADDATVITDPIPSSVSLPGIANSIPPVPVAAAIVPVKKPAPESEPTHSEQSQEFTGFADLEPPGNPEAFQDPFSILEQAEFNFSDPDPQPDIRQLTRSLVNPDDYLVSSEALRQDVVRSTPTQSYPTRAGVPRKPRPRSPWGLLLGGGLVAGGLGLVALLTLLLKPDIFQQTTGGAPTASPAVGTPSSLPGNSPIATSSPAASAPPGPDLRNKEFVDVNVGNLGSVPATSSPVAPSSTSSGTTGNSTGNSPSPQVTASPTVGQTPVALASPPPATPPVRPNPAGSDQYFYVVMDYQNPASLLQVQRVQPDAYLVQFAEGVKVQIGAYDDRQSAQDYVNALKQKGLSATIRAPKRR